MRAPCDGRLDLGAGANDAGVISSRVDVRLSETRDHLRIEAMKRLAEGVALAQNRDPCQAGLKSLEHEQFPERAAIVLRHSPFLIVVVAEKRVAFCPGTAVRLAHLVIPVFAYNAIYKYETGDYNHAGDRRNKAATG